MIWYDMIWLAREQKGGDDYYGALDDAKASCEVDGTKEAIEAVRRLEPIVKQRQEEQKEEMIGKLKDLGNMFLGNFGLSCDNFKMEQDPNTGGYSMKFERWFYAMKQWEWKEKSWLVEFWGDKRYLFR